MRPSRADARGKRADATPASGGARDERTPGSHLDWQRAGFGNEVSVNPGKFSSTTDIYWLRVRVFF